MDATTPPHELPEEGPQPFFNLPWPVSVLAILLLGIQLAMFFVPPDMSDTIMLRYGFVPAIYSDSFLAAHRVNGVNLLDRALPFVTYIFLHANWMHVIVNTVWLIAFGPVVARRFGSLRFFGFFLVCGIAGAAAHLALNWQSLNPVIGASAAISGLMAAAFRLIGTEAAPGIPLLPMAPLASRRILIWSAVWVVLNIVAGVTGIGAGPGLQLVAWEAHLGGFAAGLLLSGLFDPVNRLKVEAL
ncbi:MAG TPA: rhomboid family intramembrane serine protease [Rhizomicrobium sp.]|nr:rhomboid family intramembrane serine protease [Rhizomicrobium sp.]